jgi:hypothetical protein
VILGLVYLPRWRKLEGFQRWLLAVALLNFAANIVLSARALNMSAYWAFLLEIGAWSANYRICVEQACPHSARDSRPVARVSFMVTLRVATDSLNCARQQNT